MNEDLPIACTLDNAALTSRLAEIRTFTAASLLSHELDGRALHLRYRPEAASQLQRVVELEKACCAFLAFAVTATHEHAQLTITAPPGTDDAAGWLFAQFLPELDEAPPIAACGCARGMACRWAAPTTEVTK